jgi:glyceraldehyde 3-phosphate dehydrogenase
MSRATKRRKTDGEPQDDDLIQEWIKEEELAESLIPLLGRLYRRRNVVCTLFGAALNNISTVDIIRLHNTQSDHRGRKVTVAETAAVLSVVSKATGLGALRIDLGQLQRAATKVVESSALSFEQAIEEEIAKTERIANAVGGGIHMTEGRDVVLYGFGRIGRLLARILIEKTGSGRNMRLRAIVVRKPKKPDLQKRGELLMKDSVHGTFPCKLTYDFESNAMIVNGNLIHLIYSNGPSEVDYTRYGIKDALVVDNTGIWRNREALSGHLKAKGVGKVLLTAPGEGIPNIVFGVNEHEFLSDRSENIFSAASCTTNAVVPPIKLLDDYFGGIVKGHIETVHSFTNDQNLIDNMHTKKRRGRAAPLNMVMTETGAAKATVKCLPHLSGKLTASAIRVPVPNVSIAVMILTLPRETSKEEINSFLRERATRGGLQQVLDFSDNAEGVSSDFVGSRAGCCIDGENTRVNGNQVVIYAWYDNEHGYTCQVIRLMQGILGISHPICPPPKHEAAPNSVDGQ